MTRSKHRKGASRRIATRDSHPAESRRGLRLRVYLLAGLMLSGFALLGFRLVELQVLQAPDLAKRVERQHYKVVDVKGARGTIYDRRGRILAIDVKAPSIYAIPSAMRDRRSTVGRIAAVLQDEPLHLQRHIEGSRQFAWIKRKVDPMTAEAVESLGIRGIGVVMESRRYYPKKALFGQLLGFTGVDHQGMEGLERRYDEVLRGGEGSIRFEKDAMGRPVFPEDFEYIAPSRGNELVLTVDEYIQHVSERELDAVMSRTQAKGAMAIVLDPQTGELLALAVRPAFNPNAMPGSRPAPLPQPPGLWRNRAITDIYEPGSTFKIVTAAAALQEGMVTPDELIDCEEGSMKVPGGRIHDPFTRGQMTFQQVMASSSNVGVVKVAMRLGEEGLNRYVHAFGFGEKTGIDLIGEVGGITREVSQWSRRSLASISIGQEVGVTPLQMIMAVSVIAKDGMLMRPYLVSEIRDAKGAVIRRNLPEVRRRVLSEAVSRQLKEILYAVTRPGGTGEKAALTGYPVAGKTGTAQKIDPSTGRYARGQVVSSFVGFVPVEKPRLAILVVVDEPQGATWGGVVAAPVFRTIAQESLHHLEVAPEDEDRVLTAGLRRP